MLEFAPNTYMLEYQDGAYLCNDKKRVEAPLNLDTLEAAIQSYKDIDAWNDTPILTQESFERL